MHLPPGSWSEKNQHVLSNKISLSRIVQNEEKLVKPEIKLPKGFVDTTLVFQGQLEERIKESPIEGERKRMFSIIQWLNEHKQQILEKKEDNSGMLQGKFLKPTYLFAFENVLLNPLDFQVGEYRDIHSHKFLIYGCNPNTRSVLEFNGLENMPNFEPDTDDMHTTWRKQKEYVPSNLKDDKDYRHKACGGSLIVNQTKQLKGQGQALIFKLVDQEGDSQEQAYFLDDDQSKLNKIIKPNSGDDGFTVVINRSKVPIWLSEVGLPGIRKQSEIVDLEYLLQRLRSGEKTIQLNSRVFRIVSSTTFTKQQLASAFELEFEDDSDQPPMEQFSFTIPPQNGFGAVEDSEQNCKKLVAKPPKKDFFKQLDNTSNQKFKAYSKEKNGDVLDYILRWFDCDDTLDIYRVDAKNNGYENKRFLTRGKYGITIHDLFKNQFITINKKDQEIQQIDQKSQDVYNKLYN